MALVLGLMTCFVSSYNDIFVLPSCDMKVIILDVTSSEYHPDDGILGFLSCEIQFNYLECDN